MESFKQVLVFRSDLGMSEGKKIVQSCHASIGAYRRADKKPIEEWEKHGMKKVVVTVEDEETLKQCYQDSKESGLPAYLVKDAGKTELSPGTATCVGIGPSKSEKIDKITGKFSTL